MRFSSQHYILIATLWAVGLIQMATALAQEPLQPVPEGKAPQTVPDSGRVRAKFDYQLDNRPDPFYPFISKEAARKENEDEIVDEESGAPCTGLCRFEPGQLRLVAVMGRASEIVAMAEDVAGQGYILREGMQVGRRGQIIGIENDRVIIRETAKTRAGREINNEVVMSLKKEEKK